MNRYMPILPGPCRKIKYRFDMKTVSILKITHIVLNCVRWQIKSESINGHSCYLTDKDLTEFTEIIT